MLKTFLSAALLFPAAVYALGYEEFELFGADAEGADVRIVMQVEDKDSPLRVNGAIVGVKAVFAGQRLHAEGSTAERFRAGHCTLMFERPAFECNSEPGLLARAAFKGHTLDNESIKKRPNVNRLFESYLKRKGYGGAGAYFECVKNCGANVPRMLILVWRGD